jgi:hypothetical protein
MIPHQACRSLPGSSQPRAQRRDRSTSKHQGGHSMRIPDGGHSECLAVVPKSFLACASGVLRAKTPLESCNFVLCCESHKRPLQALLPAATRGN